MQRVTLYTRQSGTRKFKRITDRQTFAGGNFPAGTIFCLRYKHHGKRVFETLKDCPELSTAQQRQLERKLDLMRGTLPPAPEPKPATAKPVATAHQPGILMLDAAIDQYLENAKLKSAKTSTSYSRTLGQLYASCGNKPIAQIVRQDLIDFESYLRREELSDRTIHNRIVEVTTLLRHFGFKDVKHRIKFTEKTVRAYRPDELQKLFAAADAEEWLLFQFFLCTGSREQEVMTAEYADLDFVDGLFTVREKSDWKPKDREEREIPIPDFLLDALKKRLLTTKDSLIFPTRSAGVIAKRDHSDTSKVFSAAVMSVSSLVRSSARIWHVRRTISSKASRSDAKTTPGNMRLSISFQTFFCSLVRRAGGEPSSSALAVCGSASR
jgi:integrase